MILIICFLPFLIFNLSDGSSNGLVTQYHPSELEPSDSNGHILPLVFRCGIDNKNNVIDHTWLARLRYANNEYGCGGVVINGRYVLTAASCLSGEVIDRLGDLKSVTLIENSGNRLTTEYEIEETVINSEYIPNAIRGRNDVALVRLAKIVNRRQSTPICIDGFPIDRTNPPHVEGWGQSVNGQLNTIRKSLQLKFVDDVTCQELLSPYEYEVTDQDLCTALNENDYDTPCPLDGGGPLLKNYRSKWFVIGLATYNTACGHHEVPGVFTKFSTVYKWVTANMRP